MSVASEITRLQSAKAALKTAINNKNDNSHQIDDETLEDYAGFVDTIQTGAAPVVEVPSRDVNFYDYDGTIVYSYTAADFQNLTELPANPTHDGLTAQGWNWTLADAKAQVTAVGACDIGQMYVTTDGKTRLYCTFEDFNKSFYFGLGVNGTVTIDWGDESATDTLTGTNNATIQNIQHTYATAGDYLITLTVSSGTFAFLGGSSSTYLFRGNTSNVIANMAYARCLKKIEMGTGAYMRNYGLFYCVNLETITINSNTFAGSTNLFCGCSNLKFATIPNSSPIGTGLFQYNAVAEYLCLPKTIDSNTIGNSLAYDSFNIKRLVLPNATTTVGTSIAYYNISLSEVYLSNNITSIKSSAFAGCYNLKKVTIPASVTSIETKAFQNCYGVTEYHFKSTTPPTLDNVDAFSNIASDCVIYVPSTSLSSYQTATNWSTYASYMVGE